jgi:hypothetical protein
MLRGGSTDNTTDDRLQTAIVDATRPLRTLAIHQAVRRSNRRSAAGVTAFLLCVALATTLSAQFGHPLKGQWSGDWGPNPNSRTHVLVDIGWDGSALHVVVNPGANAATLTKTTVDYDTWSLRFEGDGKDASGASVHYVIEGKLQNLGAFQRFITGTWTQGSAKGEFKLTRN